MMNYDFADYLLNTIVDELGEKYAISLLLNYGYSADEIKDYFMFEDSTVDEVVNNL